MTSGKGPTHVVVDGSNIATEGRSLPSLAQLNEAVMSFMDEYPGTSITVVVDATFGHRIDKKEVKEFEEGIANNELVAPPAGAVGRGDAFVLSIAQKANASILSNDSFQEFHGEYGWLFEHGRLLGTAPFFEGSGQTRYVEFTEWDVDRVATVDEVLDRALAP